MAEPSSWSPSPELEPVLQKHPPLRRVLAKEFVPLVEHLRSKNRIRGFRFDDEFRRELLFGIVGEYVLLVERVPHLEQRDPAGCEAAVRRILSREFYRIVRRDARERTRHSFLTDLEPRRGGSPGRSPQLEDVRAADPGDEAALREALRRLEESMTEEEKALFPVFADGRNWRRSGGINYSRVARLTGIRRPLVRAVYEGMVRKLASWGYRL